MPTLRVYPHQINRRRAMRLRNEITDTRTRMYVERGIRVARQHHHHHPELP